MEPYRSSRQAAWIAILALSPLAYLGSIWLESRLPGRLIVPQFTREQAIEAANRFAASRHIDTRRWRADVGITEQDRNKNLGIVLQHAAIPALDRVATPLPFTVLLRSPQPDRWLKINVSPRGYIVGFQQNDPPKPAAPVTEAVAREAAKSSLADLLGPDSPLVPAKETVRKVGKDEQRREFTWVAPVPGFPHMKVQFYLTLVGDRVVSEADSVIFDSGYLDGFRPRHAWIVGWQVAAWVYILGLGIYALVRYIRRASDKEVSHRRTLVIALLFAALTCAIVLGDPGVLLASQAGPPQGTAFFVMIALFTALGTSIAGMFMGIAYGAGEGALRECYPGKLTALDALLSGKLFSSNVARAILTGGAIAGWLSLLASAILLALGSPRSGADLEVLRSGITPLPLLSVVLDVGSDALLLMAFGLLLPLSILRPRFQKSAFFYTLLPLLCLLCAGASANTASLHDFVISSVTLVTAILAPFLLGDLLATTSAIFALEFVDALVRRSLVSEHWRNITIEVAVAGFLLLLAEVYFSRYGRTYKEWEVRPRYARFVAEHLAMQAEISAARQAQLRLLPDAPPRISGVSIAGSCVPSRDVSGDFYDFYALDDHRLGVFLAEGGSRELGTAMTIALAKGYLLYTTRLDIGPAEILARLRAALGEAGHSESAAVSMLYAVIDTSARTVRFARSGNSPRMVINGNEPPEEVEAAADPFAVRHGSASLKPNDAVVFYTDGFEAQIARERRQTAGRFLAKLVADIRSGSALDVHSAIMQAAIRKKNEQPPDDVTAVVIRLDRQSERAMEGVA